MPLEQQAPLHAFEQHSPIHDDLEDTFTSSYKRYASGYCEVCYRGVSKIEGDRAVLADWIAHCQQLTGVAGVVNSMTTFGQQQAEQAMYYETAQFITYYKTIICRRLLKMSNNSDVDIEQIKSTMQTRKPSGRK